MKYLSPANKKHFLKLVDFAKEVIQICKENRIETVIYGSFSHFYHTKDSKMKVNDIDIYISEKDYPKLIKSLKVLNVKAEHNKKWHTLIVTKGDLRLEIDSLDFWYKDLKGKSLKKDFEDIDFYGIKVDILSLKSLEKLYLIAYSRTTDNKEKIIAKIKHLERFLGRKLKC